MNVFYFVSYYYPGGNGKGYYVCDSLGRGGFGTCYPTLESAQAQADKLNREEIERLRERG